MTQAATFTEFNYNNYVMTPVLLSVDTCDAASEVGGWGVGVGKESD